jgi:hypothetical protein
MDTDLSEAEYLDLIYAKADYVNKAVAKSILGIGDLPQEILNLTGMSSYANRLLLNHLCKSRVNYLEIGSWKGSTFISALYKNTFCRGISIDNHQEFKNHEFKTSEDELRATCEKHLVNDEQYRLITADCFSDDISLDIKFDVYFYDGFHSYEDQYKAIKHFYKNMNSIFVYICDDYSIDHIERGTKDAMRDMNIQIISEYKLFGNQLIHQCTREGFWNGLYVALCVKKDDFPQHFNEKKYTHCFDRN